jgi:hypothetical protein
MAACHGVLRARRKQVKGRRCGQSPRGWRRAGRADPVKAGLRGGKRGPIGNCSEVRMLVPASSRSCCGGGGLRAACPSGARAGRGAPKPRGLSCGCFTQRISNLQAAGNRMCPLRSHSQFAPARRCAALCPPTRAALCPAPAHAAAGLLRRGHSIAPCARRRRQEQRPRSGGGRGAGLCAAKPDHPAAVAAAAAMDERRPEPGAVVAPRADARSYRAFT